MNIFKYLSLSDRFNLECVCERWSYLFQLNSNYQPTLKIFSDKASLQQFNSNEHFVYQLKSCCYFHNSNDVLIVPNLDLMYCRLLVRLFPRLRMILLYGCETNSANLEFLLSHYRSTLHCLSLIKVNGVCWDSISLAKHKKLKHLALCGDSVNLFKSFDPGTELEELYCETFYNPIVLYNDQIRKFAFFELKNINYVNKWVFSEHLTHLSVGCDNRMIMFNQEQLIEIISKKFSSLQFLDLFLSEFGVGYFLLLFVWKLIFLFLCRLKSIISVF